MNRTYTLMILTLMLVVACAQPSARPVPQEQPPVREDTTPPPVEDVTVPPAPDTDLLEQANPDIIALTAKADTIKGYSFTLARLPKKSGEDTYWVYGTKAKVKPISLIKMSGWSADYVYVDFEKKTAFAYCIELGGCKKENKSGGVPFDAYAFTLPPDWIEPALYGEKGGQAQFNNRPVTVVSWKAEDEFYEAYLDNYYGFPQRVAIASDEAMTTITGGYEYQGLSFAVTQDDVTPPY